MRINLAEATTPAPDVLDLHLQFSGLDAERVEAARELVDDVKAGLADGRLTTEEGADIVADLVAFMNPRLGARIQPLETTIAWALRDGKVSLRESALIAFGMMDALRLQ